VTPTDALLAARQPDTSKLLLLRAALACFVERGYHATRTRDISQGAGMSPAAMYVHYSAKEELLHQLVNLGYTEALAVVRAAADSAADPVDRLAAMVRAFAAFHARHHDLARVSQFELHALGPDHLAEVTVPRQQAKLAFRAEIERGVRAGAFQVTDVRGATLALLSLTVDVARWYRPDGRLTPEGVAENHAELALRMLRAG
jgi:AcrR family transcriptional regulator